MTMIEERIRAVLASQAAAMHTRSVEPLDGELVDVTQLPVRRRPRLLMAAAAAILLAGAGVALAQRHADDSAGNSADQPADPAAVPAFRFETPTVLLQAASVEVTVADKSFVPGADLRVGGDPGTPNEYTTLELTWHEFGVEQRIYLYFASDGIKWWATEIRTYDGAANGGWIERQGRFFETPVGAAYTGDVDLPNLKIHGMRLQAFLRPASCDNPTAPLALIANYPTIDSFAGGGYGATLQVVDTATCRPLPASGFTFEYTSDDPAIAAISEPLSPPDYPPVLTRVGLELVAPGTTTIHAVARDQAGNVVGTADMHVVVGPPDATIVADSAPPIP